MPARPFVVAVGELQRHPGTQRAVTASGPLPGLALSTARVPDDSDVEAELVLEAQHDSLTATGTVRAPWAGECRRCLLPIEGVATAHVQEVYARHPIDGETYPLVGDEVDLEPMIRDAVLLALPLAPLCSDGCPGPDPDGYPVTVDGAAAGVEGAPPDPRWAALDELSFDQ